MQFFIKRQYDCTAQLLNLNNPEDLGVDQYVADYTDLGPIKCYIGVDPTYGRLTLEVPELIQAENPLIYNPQNKDGVPLGKQSSAWQLGSAIPVINAYGQVGAFKYTIQEGKK